MRRVTAVVTTALGMVWLGMALAIPAQAQPDPIRAASDSHSKIATICQRDVAVRKSSDGRIIGHLHKGQKFKVISFHDNSAEREFGFERGVYSWYHGYAYGNVHAYGDVPEGSFCR